MICVTNTSDKSELAVRCYSRRGVVIMEKMRRSESISVPGLAMIAAGIGAIAVGAFAIGALAIGRIAVRHLGVQNSKFKSLEIRDLTVTRLHIAEITVSESIRLPDNTDRPLAS